MGLVAGNETTQWFLKVKAKILKWYPKFGKVVGELKKNQPQSKQWNIKSKRISSQDFRTFEWLKSQQLQFEQRDRTPKRIGPQDFGIIGGFKKNQQQPYQWNQKLKSRSPNNFKIIGRLKSHELQLQQQNFEREQIWKPIHWGCFGLVKYVQRIPHKHPLTKDRVAYF